MKLRIHHFFDIIRDFGSGKEITPHPHGHSYHRIAKLIENDATIELELIIASDAICEGCSHLVNGFCDDIITHRKDFAGKEDFNNHLDGRIMKVCGLKADCKYSPEVLCEFADKYLEKIDFIYEGNDLQHTAARKKNVENGLRFYAAKHGFKLKF